MPSFITVTYSQNMEIWFLLQSLWTLLSLNPAESPRTELVYNLDEAGTLGHAGQETPWWQVRQLQQGLSHQFEIHYHYHKRKTLILVIIHNLLFLVFSV